MIRTILGFISGFVVGWFILAWALTKEGVTKEDLDEMLRRAKERHILNKLSDH